MVNDKSNYAGIIYSFLSAVLFGIMGALVKKLSFTLPSTEIVFARGLLSLLIISVIMIIKKDSFTAGNKKVLVSRGIFGGLGLLCFFYAISNMKLGDASILLQMAPIFVVLFASLFLGERIQKSFYIVLVLAFLGAIFVVKPTPENLISFPAITGLLGAVFAAAAYVTIRKLGTGHSPYLIICYFVGASVIFSFPLMITVFKVPNLKEMILLIGVGILSATGQICLTKAYQLEKAGIVAMIGYSVVIHHTLWGFFAFKEVLDIYSITGGVIILASCTYITLFKNRQKIKKSVKITI